MKKKVANIIMAIFAFSLIGILLVVCLAEFGFWGTCAGVVILGVLLWASANA